MRTVITTALLFIATLAAPSAAHAQFNSPFRGGVNPASRPTVSPWINLATQPINPANVYYGIVRPEIQAGYNFQQLQQNQGLLAGQIQQDFNALNNSFSPTGHGAGFMTQSRYFLTRNAPGGAGGRAGAGPGLGAAPRPAGY